MLLAEQVTPYEKVEYWLIAYADWKARLAYVQTELTHIPGLTKALHEVTIYGSGQPKDTLLRTVIHRLEITEYEIPFLRSRIGLIEYAFSALTPEERRFVQLRYQDQLAFSIVMDRIGLSRRTYFNHRKRILQKIYHKIKSRTALLEYDPF
ncbi:hypothetical protein [Cohnella silvisoli]|uniref:Sigma-70 family RNA polymerase sigma factor n=1 Tax=Cohnella silvisoli TaxID=2873699 RepID=A0ABV1L1L4_9BACL|nr:hypothetical protein [Cohnella silvisoli]MCD9025411.1 hypothetical protein [Cohnella silvisoli]